MDKHSTIVRRAGLLATALLAISCSESVGPERGSPGAPLFSFSSSGITLSRDNGALGYSGRLIRKGFNPTNPHHGDAVIATFYWFGSTNVIDSVTDVLTDATFTPVGNKFTLVEYVTAGGMSMATYVATNIQNFPDPNPGDIVYAVQANLRDSIPDGGVKLTAWTGVEDVFVSARGAVHSGSVSASTPTPVRPGPITIGAGSVAYAVSMSNGGVGLQATPAGFTSVGGMGSDGRIQDDGRYLVSSSGGAVDPQWTWDFQRPSTALATVLELRPGRNAANQPPVAAFTSSCSGLTCSFTSTSSDPDGSITAYSWTFGDGGTSTAANPSHSYAAGGTYTATLTVTDNQGATNAVSHSVTVAAANQSPVAAFTSTCSGLTCSFTSTSSDPDGSITAYSWTFGDGGTSTAANPSHRYAAGGTYTVRLTVTDNQGATNSTSRSVTVTAPNQPPVAGFNASCSGLTCNFTSTSSDPDGSITAYSWTFGDGGTSTVQNPSHSYAAGGTYTVRLTVADNQGGTNSVSKTVTVAAPNQPPSVNAGPDQTALTGLLYSLSASFSDANGNGPWSYTIHWGDGSTSTGTRSTQGTFTVGHTYFTILPRSFTITVTVRDAAGAAGSDTKVVRVVLL